MPRQANSATRSGRKTRNLIKLRWTQALNLIAQVEMDHGTKDPNTGNELTYEVNQPEVEDKEEEEEEDTVFSEEEQRLVKESVQRMHERLLSKKRQRRPKIKKRQRSQRARRGMAGIRRVGLSVQDQGYRPINQVLLG